MKKELLYSLLGTLCGFGAALCLGAAAGFWGIGFQPAVLLSLILILPAALWIVISGINAINSLAAALGIGLALILGGWFPKGQALWVILCVLLLWGALLLLGRAGKNSFDVELKKLKERRLNQESILLKSVFVNSNNKNIARNISGGAIGANLCDIAYDFSEVKQSCSVALEAKAVLGNILLILPECCELQLNAVNSFGKIIDRTKENQVEKEFVLTVNAKTIFGKIIIQNG